MDSLKPNKYYRQAGKLTDRQTGRLAGRQAFSCLDVELIDVLKEVLYSVIIFEIM
jgi:hypothetical protein